MHLTRPRQLCDSCPKLARLSQKVKISIIPSLFCHLLVGISPNCFVSFRRLSECRIWVSNEHWTRLMKGIPVLESSLGWLPLSRVPRKHKMVKLWQNIVATQKTPEHLEFDLNIKITMLSFWAAPARFGACAHLWQPFWFLLGAHRLGRAEPLHRRCTGPEQIRWVSLAQTPKQRNSR